ncbi:sulfatase-like hydrolase/transferase [Avibacterium sp. 21-595]|uniref:sulfatase family protein n=1 Tax=unclassified Avibacterium TaxID=2685287 RepID=UPI0020269DF2|nr:sulfatase-like hydrolase/transferase [Avibacterium sp. 21-595]URL02594.1 sulfatase-like hydrolase/transferase [Avibacterium sp. 20-126]URL07248.1 sulfatase-like hydrolase/transferase [Avibacterium sp. 21-595]
MKRSLLSTCLLSAMVAGVSQFSFEAQAAEPTRPNVLVIVMDDLGSGQLDFAIDSLDAEALNQRPVAARYQGDINKMIEAAQKAMPNVSKLAASGVKMTNAFVAHPVCGPSRAGIFTGRYPASFGIYSNDDSFNGIPLDVKLLPALFQENGYATANIGKYHNAKINRDRKIGRITQPEDLKTRDYHDNFSSVPEKGYFPTDRGFDYSYSYFVSGAALWHSPALWRNDKPVASPGYLTHNLTNEALQFIDKVGDKPFFLNLAYSVPHIPLEEASPAKYMDRFNTGNVEADKYFAAINAADEGIGKIIDKLKAEGKLENTLIFFLSDNGSVHEAPMPLNGMDRGFKGQLYNGGLRVPFIVSWPNHIPANSQNDQLISAIDILPTALKAAKISLPDSLKLDGKDILPILSGKETVSPHQYLYWAGPGAKHYSEENQQFWADYWKYITYNTNQAPKNPHLEKLSKSSWAIRDKDWALYFYNDGSNQLHLYHDKVDPAESKDVASQYPEKVKELQTAFHHWISKQPKPMVWNPEEFQAIEASAEVK